MSTEDDPTDPQAHAGLPLPPPLIPAGALLVAALLTAVMPLPLGRGSLALGAFAASLGLLLALWAVVTLRRHRTAVIPHHPTTALVESGPYAHTRNPIYLGMALVVLGVAIAIGGWFWIAALAVPPLLDKLIIAREEHYLTARFPRPYQRYCGRVRRWF